MRNRFGIDFRKAFYEQLDYIILPSFGEYSNPCCPELRKLRALDWFFAVLARLLRRWREARHRLSYWEARFPEDAEAIERAVRRQTEIRVIRGRGYREETFPWDHKRTAFSRTVPDHTSVLGIEVLSRLTSINNVRHAAETAAYLMFQEFLSCEIMEGTKSAFCLVCDGIFSVIRSRRTFCSNSCGKCFAKNELYRRRYMKRVDVAIRALKQWLGGWRRGSWRDHLEQRLFEEKCVATSNSRRYPIVGAWIRAANSPPHSTERQRVIRRWFMDESANYSKCGSEIDKFNELYALIIEAQSAT
jgi:hypothetical protein